MISNARLGADLAWQASTSKESKKVEERALNTGSSIYMGTGVTDNSLHVQNGDIVPEGTTHIAILVNGKVENVSLSTLESGVVTSLTEFTATIGSTQVYLLRPGLSSLNSSQFGTKGDGITNDRPAFVRCMDYARSAGIRNVKVPLGTYVVPNPVNANDVYVEIEDGTIFVDTDGTTVKNGFQKYNRWADIKLSGGDRADYRGESLLFGNSRESWIQPSTGDGDRSTIVHSNTTWYDNPVQAVNAFTDCGVKHYETNIHYGAWNKSSGKPSSGSATGNIASIIVHGAEKGSDGTSRTEIIPFGCGAVVRKDAQLRPGALNIYNDFVVSGVVDGTQVNKEAFLAGISILAQTYSPYSPPDSTHSGSYGMCITTKPQRAGAWDQGDITTDSAFSLRAMLSICGWSGGQDATSGAHPSALVGAQYGILIGGGDAGQGGGSQWIGSFARSKFNHGVMVTDYRLNGILIDQPSSDAESFVNAIHVKPGAGRIYFQNGDLVFGNLPDQVNSVGLDPGQVYRDSSNGNILKVAF